MKRVIVAMLLVFGALIGGGLWRFLAERSPQGPPSATVRAVLGPAEETIEEVGVIQAANYSRVVAPFREKLVKLVEEGTFVKQGDPVAWMEDHDIQIQLASEKSAYESRKAELEKYMEYRRLSSVRDELAVHVAQADLDFSRSNLAYYGRVETLMERLFGMRVIPESRLEQARLQTEQGRLDVTSKECKLRLAEATWRASEETVQSDVQYTQSALDLATRQLKKSESRLDEAVLKAPVDGLVVWEDHWDWSVHNRVKIKEGELLRFQEPIIKMPDMKDLYVKSQVSEMRMLEVTPGTPARIRVDALNDLLIPAKVRSVAGLAIERARAEGAGFVKKGADEDRVFELDLELSSISQDLRPGMTVSVSLTIGRIDQAITVPKQAVFRSAGKNVVYKLEKGKEVEIPVTLGFEAHDRRVVLEGLKSGDEILMEKP